MPWYLLVLRVLHILSGALWVGMMGFTVLFLTPALREAGPAGQPVMGALQRRHLMVVIPSLALLTIISGLLMVFSVYGNLAVFVATRMGLTLTAGAVASLIAFGLGIGVMRPAMLEAGRLGASVSSLATDAERAAASARLQALRARASSAGGFVLGLLVLAATAMAVARYV